MTKLLLLETATSVCSVALSEGSAVVAEATADAPYQHSSQITLLIQRVLADTAWSLSSIDALALSSGPGSYTSLRVGAATAKGIAYTLHKPLIVVDTLASLALAAKHPNDPEAALYVPMIDARRQEVYTAVFAKSGKRLAETQALILTDDPFAKWKSDRPALICCGDGATKARQLLTDPVFKFRPEIQCSARFIQPIAALKFTESAFEDVTTYEPLYLKSPYVTVPKARL